MYNMLSIAAVFDFCAEDGVLKTFKIVGYLITIIKVLIPLLLIIFGSIDFGKAVVASDDKAISKAAQMLVVRAVGGIIIFFIPTIVHFATSLINSWSGIKSEFINCETCMNQTGQCDELRREICTEQKNDSVVSEDAKTITKLSCSWDSELDMCNCTKKTTKK